MVGFARGPVFLNPDNVTVITGKKRGVPGPGAGWVSIRLGHARAPMFGCDVLWRSVGGGLQPLAWTWIQGVVTRWPLGRGVVLCAGVEAGFSSVVRRWGLCRVGGCSFWDADRLDMEA